MTTAQEAQIDLENNPDRWDSLFQTYTAKAVRTEHYERHSYYLFADGSVLDGRGDARQVCDCGRKPCFKLNPPMAAKLEAQ